MSVESMAFILGGLLVAVAILGGGIEVRELKIPSVGRTSRVLAFIVGAVFISLAVFLNPPEKDTHPSANTSAPPLPAANPSRVDATTVAPAPTKGEVGDNVEWLTAAQYQLAFNKKVRDGFYPSKVQGRCKDDGEQFYAEWKQIPLGAGFFSHHAITKEFYERKNHEYVSQGYSLESLNILKDCSGRDRYQATWFKRT
jgi:Polyglycine hydrolase-like, structural repeat